MSEPRWDPDERRHGVRDAAEFEGPVRRLLETLPRAGWVAEQPEAHLLPHLERVAAERGWSIVRWADLEGVLELDLDVGGDRSHRARQEAAYALIGAIAESSTHVRQPERGTYEVLTGMLPGDGDFATHGHVVRIRTVAPEEG